jgi:hypothetical protein
MDTNHEIIKARLWANLLTLTEACPVEQCHSAECVVHQLRKKHPTRQLAWFEALSPDDLAYLTAYHHVCLQTKVAPPAERRV